MATLRAEFISVKQSNNELYTGADNVISGRAAPSVEPTITGTALTGAGRVTVPVKCAVRLTAIGGPAYVEWGAPNQDPVASSTNGIRLGADQAETFLIPNGYLISAMVAGA